MATPIQDRDPQSPTPADPTAIQDTLVNPTIEAAVAGTSTDSDLTTRAGFEGVATPTVPQVEAGESHNGGIPGDIDLGGTPEKEPRKWGRKIGAVAVAAITVVSGVAVWLGIKGKPGEGSSQGTEQIVPVIPGAEPVQPETPTQEVQGPSGEPEHLRNPNGNTTPENSVFNPETDSTTGNIRIARIIDGEPTIIVDRANGDKITVPRIRHNENLDTEEGRIRFMESAAAVLAAYLTTNNQAHANLLAQEFSTNERVRESMAGLRAQLHGVSSNDIEPDSGGTEAAQAAIFDDRNNPAVIRSGIDREGYKYVEFRPSQGGKMFLNMWSHPEWQHPDTHQLSRTLRYNHEIADFGLRVDKGPDGKQAITGWALEFVDR